MNTGELSAARINGVYFPDSVTVGGEVLKIRGAGLLNRLFFNVYVAALYLPPDVPGQNALEDVAEKYMGFGAPSRARYEASMSPGFDPMSIPGYAGALDSTSKNVLARLSATGGNPFGNPGGLIDANKQIVSGTALPAINEYQRLNANTGFGSSMNAAANFQTAGVGADQGIYGALGYGLGNLLNPPKTGILEQILRMNEGKGL